MAEIELSRQARSLWAKSDAGFGEEWLPLFVHMCDCSGVIDRLWRDWMPIGVKKMLERESGVSEQGLNVLVRFLGAVHDIGKATPIFQGSTRFRAQSEYGDLSWKAERAGLDIHMGLCRERRPKHAVAGEVILAAHLTENCGWSATRANALSSMVGAHHGKPPILRDVVEAVHKPTALGWDDAHAASWRAVQTELMQFAESISGLDLLGNDECGRMRFPVHVESALVGLMIMADWIASNQSVFPLVPVLEPMGPTDDGSGLELWLERRVADAWGTVGILPCWDAPPSGWEIPFAERFGLPEASAPRPVQEAVMRVARTADDLGIIVVEAPMGEGKTEAALAASEILAGRYGRGGVCVALPTMATTDSAFSRVHRWIENLPRGEGLPESVYLAHGKAGLNEEYQGLLRSSRSDRYGAIDQDDEAVGPKGSGARATAAAEVSDWMRGRKKGMLANFVVCTVDQVLMGALTMKHLSLRHLALMDKVVIIDECHAYDMYMQQYLNRILEWLGAWRTPVVLLSATLPASLRKEFIASYIKGRSVSGPNASVGVSGGPGGTGSVRSSFRRMHGARLGTEAKSSPADASKDACRGYPLITYSTGETMMFEAVRPSSRTSSIELSLLADDEDSLASFANEMLADGGCMGVVCDTVRRAQHAFAVLSQIFGPDEVVLTHSRFTDIDRMANEEMLRRRLGPHARRSCGTRPERLIVVGTQVIEQSLDIDFDVMVTDVAPIDLLLQRIGRLHRHARGEGELERPAGLRKARCYIRGIEDLSSGSVGFVRGVEAVYERASLLESLSVCGISAWDDTVTLELPGDIARLVQGAYCQKVAEHVPACWKDRYSDAVARRDAHQEAKRRRAQACLLKSVSDLVKNGKGLIGLFDDTVDAKGSALRGRDEDRGPRAVRDTQETVEVLLACERADGIHLLPWIGDEPHGVEKGSRIPVEYAPEDSLARVLSQSSVRLPLEMCPGGDLDHLLCALEDMSEPYVGAWQESGWLAGELLVVMREAAPAAFTAELLGWHLTYTEQAGLSAVRGEDIPKQNITS